VFLYFTDDTRHAVLRAQDEARRMNHLYVGTEHLLLGLVDEGDGAAVRALASLGIAPDAVRDLIREAIPHGPEPPAPGLIPLTPRAKTVLELSVLEAHELGHRGIESEDLLVGLVREGDGVAARVLAGLGASLTGVRQEIRRLGAE
jgi:ATP-dependent Clp protease ATP-binding subunit ClpC